MRKICKIASTVLLVFLMSCFFLPYTASAEKTVTTTFQTVTCNDTGVINFVKDKYTNDYPQGSKMATMTITGNSVVFYIPAIGNITHDLTIHGKIDPNYYTKMTPGWKDPERNLQNIGSISGSFSTKYLTTSDNFNVYKGGEIQKENFSSTVHDFDNDKIVRWFNYGLQSDNEHVYSVNIYLAGYSSYTYPSGMVVGYTFNTEGSCKITLTNPVKTTTQSHTGYASTDPGEDEGFNFAAIGGGVAVAIGVGIALAGGKKNGGRKDGNKKKTASYKMYVYKDFGDAIGKGAAPVRVCARIAQIVDGKESDCPEQTRNIKCSGENLTVSPAGMSGRYLAALVSADANSTADQGTVTFTLTSTGGVFTRNVIFRIVGEPSIIFPRDTEDGNRDLNTRNDSVDLIAGLGGQEKLRFAFRDAAAEPVDIRFSETDGLRITSEKDTRYQFTYYAVIGNNTPKAAKENNIFAEEENRQITIFAKFPDGKEITGNFSAVVYPDGLFVKADRDKKKDGRLLVDTLPEEMGGDWNGAKAIPGTTFDLYVTYVDDSGHAVIRKNPGGLNHKERLADSGRYGKTFTDNFTFRINHGGSTGITIYPEETLPSSGDPFTADLEISSRVDGMLFEGNVPLALTGEKPERPSSAVWQEAYRMLQRDVRFFGVGNDPQLRAMMKQVNDMSASQIADLRKAIIEAGVGFYRRYGDAHREYEELLGKYLVVSGCLVKAGDYAVEYLLKYYFAGYGVIASKFLNQMKNMLATYAGEYIANGNIDRAPDFVETVLKGVEESLAAAITGTFFGDDLSGGVNVDLVLGGGVRKITAPPVKDKIQEVLGYIIAAYLLTCFARHYTRGVQGEKGDIYRSAVASVADLGLESLKAWFLDYVSRACGSLFETIGNYCGKLYLTICKKKIAEAAREAGKDAFGNSIRNSMKFDMRGLSNESYEAAKLAGNAAKLDKIITRTELAENVAKMLRGAGRNADGWLEGVKEATGGLTAVAAGQGLNYALGGDGEDESVSVGTDLKEVVYNSLSGWFGISPQKIYDSGGMLNPMDVTLRIENGKIVLGMLGCYSEIGIRENIEALVKLVFETMFSWMEPVFRIVTTPPDFAGGPDLRDNTRDGEEFLQELEDAKRRVGNPQWRAR